MVTLYSPQKHARAPAAQGEMVAFESGAYSEAVCRPRSLPELEGELYRIAWLFHHDQPRSPSGIGLESALLFASEGANVILADVNLPAAEKGASLIGKEYCQQLGVQAFALKADVSKEEEVKALVDFAVGKFGRLDVMVRQFPVKQCRY